MRTTKSINSTAQKPRQLLMLFVLLLPTTSKLNYLLILLTSKYQLCKENYLMTHGSNHLDLFITGRKGQQLMRNNNAVLTKPKNVICGSGSVLTVLGLGARLIVIVIPF